MKILKTFRKKEEGRKMKFEAVADEWLEYKKNSIKSSTYYDYLRIIENQLKPKFKNTNMNDITNLNDYVSELSSKLSPKTVRKNITILKSIINYYEDEYECKLKIKKISLPKLDKTKAEIFTKKEILKLEKYCTEQCNLENVGILIALNTGLRIGEICGLKWKNIDMIERKIYVGEIVERIYDCKNKKSILITAEPKTKGSKRFVVISNKLYKILKPLRNKYDGNSYILSGNEKVIDPRTYENIFSRILGKNKIKHRKFHCLRHTFATNCIQVGMDTKSLSEILGHSNVSVTLSTYVHSSDNLKKKYLEMI